MKLKTGLLCLLLALVLSLSGCEQAGHQAQPENDLTVFEHSTLGVVTGSLFDGYSRAVFPEAQIDYYNSFADLFQCIKQKKVDAFMLDEASFSAVQRTDDRLDSIPVPEYAVDLGFGFQKNEGGDVLQGQMNTLLDRLEADGTMAALIEKWYGEKEPEQTLLQPDFSDNPTPLNVAVDTTRKPFVYLLNSQPAGLEIEVLYLFCEEYGYAPTFSDVPFASGLAGLAGEKYEMVCGGLYMTAERKQSVNFSDPYMSASVILVTYSSDEQKNLWASLKSAFSKTFLQENRWQLILSGIGTTLLISLLSVLLGSLIGFAFYLASRSSWAPLSFAAKALNKFCTVMVRGTPTLVVLMLLYYVVFGNSRLSGSIVAVLGFTLIFASFVNNHLKLSVDNLDKGQLEAAYALGYGRNRAFFRIVFPQAMNLFFPVYTEKIVDLVKATSVVGYIAVNDLTKMADIIRSNTYEAFFPLLAVTAIYFAIVWGITGLMYLLRRSIATRRKHLTASFRR